MEGPVHNQKPSLEKIKDWIKISALIGATFVGGKVATEAYKNHEKNREYDTHIEQSMTQQEKEALDDNFKQIEKYFGKEAVDKIRSGDKTAFFEKQKKELRETEYIGFENAGVSTAAVKKFISEETFFPRNFIEGEVDRLYFSDSVIKSDEQVANGVFMGNLNTLVIFLKSAENQLSEIDKENLLFYIKYICSHELGHANDWETDRESNLLERAELLKKIAERLGSEDKMVTQQQSEEPEYYDAQTNPYTKAKEYWAELCKMYFSGAPHLQKEFPKDFEIIDNFVKKQDPNFDVFKTVGVSFKGLTGQEALREWQKFIKDAISLK